MTILNNQTEKNHVVEQYIPLVKYIASRIIMGKTKYVEYEDLVSYGMIGLMDALNKFDESKGMKFSTYAAIRIKGSMIDELRKNSPISKGAMDKLNKYNEAVENLQNRFLREPNSQEVAKEMDISLSDLTKIENYINYISIVSLESLMFNDDDDISLIGTIEDKKIIGPEKSLEQSELIEYLGKAIDLLRDKDRLIITLYYYEKLTLKEIGKILEVSESRVCQLHSKAIINLRKALKKLKYEIY
ncbi:FliA/WhiG family RNA polymerase sigma factor [Clostridium sp. ATCC 25772]|uniref:FliA/WhiG family RNA polymerase sigma factor n=1 Tax=Clostridium sp. ATCC 25772 TaxID=1676991 RepID=UPI0007822F97|nr:FliA/WhiG family RNA polymerase sigma factor [Clostridium sp. ATCC 25772]